MSQTKPTKDNNEIAEVYYSEWGDVSSNWSVYALRTAEFIKNSPIKSNHLKCIVHGGCIYDRVIFTCNKSPAQNIVIAYRRCQVCRYTFLFNAHADITDIPTIPIDKTNFYGI